MQTYWNRILLQVTVVYCIILVKDCTAQEHILKCNDENIVYVQWIQPVSGWFHLNESTNFYNRRPPASEMPENQLDSYELYVDNDTMIWTLTQWTKEKYIQDNLLTILHNSTLPYGIGVDPKSLLPRVTNLVMHEKILNNLERKVKRENLYHYVGFTPSLSNLDTFSRQDLNFDRETDPHSIKRQNLGARVSNSDSNHQEHGNSNSSSERGLHSTSKNEADKNYKSRSKRQSNNKNNEYYDYDWISSTNLETLPAVLSTLPSPITSKRVTSQPMKAKISTEKFPPPYNQDFPGSDISNIDIPHYPRSFSPSRNNSRTRNRSSGLSRSNFKQSRKREERSQQPQEDNSDEGYRTTFKAYCPKKCKCKKAFVKKFNMEFERIDLIEGGKYFACYKLAYEIASIPEKQQLQQAAKDMLYENYPTNDSTSTTPVSDNWEFSMFVSDNCSVLYFNEKYNTWVLDLEGLNLECPPERKEIQYFVSNDSAPCLEYLPPPKFQTWQNPQIIHPESDISSDFEFCNKGFILANSENFSVQCSEI